MYNISLSLVREFFYPRNPRKLVPHENKILHSIRNVSCSANTICSIRITFIYLYWL